MKNWMLLVVLSLLLCGMSWAQGTEKLIYNGVPWFDDRGEIVNAHGACIVEENGRYYLFGEWKSDESNAFPGFSCYSSDDLVNWKFERVVLPMQPDGILGPNRVGERVKVMKCPSTGEYVMFMHADNMNYKDPHIGYATCSTIAGEYKLHGPLLYEGKPIRRWDMGTYQDVDGTGYLLLHGGIVYRLSKDYRSAEEKVVSGVPGSHGESPAMFKKDGTYFFLFSNLTSWEKNDNFYYTAPSVKGPWTSQGLFAPEGSLTFNSQTTFVFPLKRGNDTIPMFMGDRWSYPHQASAATYVWMPIQVDGTKLTIPEYWPAWDMDQIKPVDPLRNGKLVSREEISLSNPAEWKMENGHLASNVAGASLNVPFDGSRMVVVGETNAHSGYAQVNILNKRGEKIYSSLVDFYSKVKDEAIRFMTPPLVKDEYTLVVEVTGNKPTWTDKTKTIYGSNNSYVTIKDIYYVPTQVVETGFIDGNPKGFIRHPWQGKRVGYLGDSITDPNCYGDKIKKYWSFLEEWLGITPFVYGVSGRQWNDVPRQAEQLKKEHGEEVDALLVLLGTNDFNEGIPVGEWYTEKKEQVMAARGKTKKLETRIKRTLVMDNRTYKGRINIGISRLKSLFPDKQIILLTPLHRSFADFGEKNVQPDESYQNRCGEYVDAYVLAVKEAANVWGVPVIDFNAVTGMNPMVEGQLEYFYDPTFDRLHPSTKGQERMARTLMYQLLAFPCNY